VSPAVLIPVPVPAEVYSTAARPSTFQFSGPESSLTFLGHNRSAVHDSGRNALAGSLWSRHPAHFATAVTGGHLRRRSFLELPFFFL